MKISDLQKPGHSAASCTLLSLQSLCCHFCSSPTFEFSRLFSSVFVCQLKLLCRGRRKSYGSLQVVLGCSQLAFFSLLFFLAFKIFFLFLSPRAFSIIRDGGASSHQLAREALPALDLPAKPELFQDQKKRAFKSVTDYNSPCRTIPMTSIIEHVFNSNAVRSFVVECDILELKVLNECTMNKKCRLTQNQCYMLYQHCRTLH